MNTFMIVVAKYFFLIPVLMPIVYALFQPRAVQKRMLLLAVIILPLSYIVAKIGSHLYFDPRPFVVMHVHPLIPHAPDNGFPSDHELISAAFASILFVFNKKWGIAAFILAVFVGYSRVYTLVHHPLDIVGSFVISIVVMVAVVYGLRRFFRFGI